MTILIDPSFHKWFVLLLTVGAIVFFVREKVPLEVTSVGILMLLMLFGQFFPLPDANDRNLLNSYALLSGLANPSLIAVMALLVMGQAMIHTDSLRFISGVFQVSDKRYVWFSIVGIMLFVLVVSAFMNNTPLVIIAIPIIQLLASKAGLASSRIMIPLSYVAILGGMTTLIGSSTNLLVSSTMQEIGYKGLGFFDFLVPGAILAGIGLLYILLIVPRLLVERRTMARDLAGGQREFVAELDISEDSKLIGAECVEGKFEPLRNLNVKMIQRGGQLILPPFEGYKIEAHDILIVTASRENLTELLSKYPGFLLSEEEARLLDEETVQDENDQSISTVSGEPRVLAEIMITPASRLIDMSLENSGFGTRFGTIVLGIQRRARVVRRRLGRIRLEAGDVLLVAGRQSMTEALRNNTDFIVLSGSKKDLPRPNKAWVAISIFLVTIGSAAAGIITIPVAAVTGAVTMLATGCLNIRQAIRALDRKIYLLVASMLALGTALQVTGAASYLAELLLGIPMAETPIVMASLLFIIVALATNVLTNNACAILFTPIALNLAGNLEVPETLNYDIAFIFAVTVIMGANCSFASPIGYQTNLLVMGPGHYRFRDFIKAGIPLILVLWISYIFILKYYFGL